MICYIQPIFFCSVENQNLSAQKPRFGTGAGVFAPNEIKEIMFILFFSNKQLVETRARQTLTKKEQKQSNSPLW